MTDLACYSPWGHKRVGQDWATEQQREAHHFCGKQIQEIPMSNSSWDEC